MDHLGVIRNQLLGLDHEVLQHNHVRPFGSFYNELGRINVKNSKLHRTQM